MPCSLGPLSRRSALHQIGAAGAAFAGFTALPSASRAALFPEGTAIERLEALFQAAGGSALGAIAPIRIDPATKPFAEKLMNVEADQPVTFLLTGRWHVVRELGIWFEPGLLFHARIDGGTLYNPSSNTGTMIAEKAGRIEFARAAGEFAGPDGSIWTPMDVYHASEGLVEGVAIAWSVDPQDGLAAIAAKGDVGGLVAAERRRLAMPPVTPSGWHNHYSFGEGGIFSECGGDEMCCETQNNVAILQRDIDRPLTKDLALSWRWLVNELPSVKPEDQVLSHDYMSIGVEFDDGQDITYLWSHDLPKEHAFRCPLPGWNAIETHVVQRTGLDELGTWQSESRSVATDYEKLIGGDAQRIVRIWLLGVSVFQRRAGSCRFADIVVDPSGDAARLL